MHLMESPQRAHRVAEPMGGSIFSRSSARIAITQRTGKGSQGLVQHPESAAPTLAAIAHGTDPVQHHVAAVHRYQQDGPCLPQRRPVPSKSRFGRKRFPKWRTPGMRHQHESSRRRFQFEPNTRFLMVSAADRIVNGGGTDSTLVRFSPKRLNTAKTLVSRHAGAWPFFPGGPRR